MEPLKNGQIRVHLKSGTSYVCPEQNKKSVVHCIDKNIARIEHYKPPKPAPTPKAKPAPVPKAKDVSVTVVTPKAPKRRKRKKK